MIEALGRAELRHRSIRVPARTAAGKRSGRWTRGGAIVVPAEQPDRLHWVVLLFLVGLVIPWVIMIGPLRLSVYRLVLLATTIPCLVIWARGGAGRVRVADLAMLAFCAWGTVCLMVNHGVSDGIQPSGILFIESAGPYFMARCFIRNERQFEAMVRLLFWVILAMLPLGLVELLTGYKATLRLFDLVMPSVDETLMDVRWGLRRVQGPFEHPILFGVFCGGILAMTLLVLGYKKKGLRRWGRAALVGATSLLSLSSGPMSAIVVQILLLGWNWALGAVEARWKILWALVIALYISISVYSGRSVAAFYISHAPLFDAWSAYYRLLIWEFGSATVARHPIFGIGLNEYERPSWMTASVDMFWLNNAIMFGLIGAILLVLIVGASAALVGFRRNLTEQLYAYRAGYLISMAGFFIAGWGVHFWNGTYSYFLFLVGSGVWLAERGGEQAAGTRRGAGHEARPELPGRRAMFADPAQRGSAPVTRHGRGANRNARRER